MQISYCGDNGDSQSTMRKLFDSAAVLFSKYEFDDVTVDAIVESAGVAKGTFYLYFKSKDALIAAFLLDYVSRLDAEYKRHLDSQPRGASASDLLLSLTEKIADMVTGQSATTDEDRYKVMLAHDVNMDTITGYNRFLYEISADVIRGVKRRATVLARLMIGKTLCDGHSRIYEWCIRYPDFDLKEHALTHVRIMLNGICAKPGSSL